MKLNKFFISALCGMMVLGGFSSCSDDDDYDDSWKEGSVVDLPNYRAFVLSEGSFNGNNSHLFFVNPLNGATQDEDIYEAQNGKKLGDTANDMIEADGDIYIVVNVSGVLLRLNGSGVEQKRYTDFSTLGAPRNIVEEDGKLYVTCYGGYVARFDAKTLTLEKSVKVDNNPEQIIEHNDKLYCVNSGFGMGNTMSVIDINKFDVAESVEIVNNPFGIQEDNGHIYIMAYDKNYNSYVSVYDEKAKTCTKIADADKMYAHGDYLYLAKNTTPDYKNYTMTYSVYNANTGSTSTWNMSSIPDEMTSGNSLVYMIERNPYDGSFYIGMTNYFENSTLYHISSTGNFINKIPAGGISPNSMVFLK